MKSSYKHSILLLGIFATNSLSLPELELKTKWKTTLEETEFMGYSSSSFTIADEVIYVLNGANVGNAVLKFDLEGNYLEEFPGWYNWPHDIVVGGQNQVLLSALGAMGDDTMLRFGMVMYDSAGEFFHGFHEAETGLKRPQGLALMPGSEDLVLVCDWDGNVTSLIQVDWENGVIDAVTPIFETEYPMAIAVDDEKIVVVSMVCCETWHDQMIKLSIFDFAGNLLTEVKELETGEAISSPVTVAIDTNGDIWMSDQDLLKTLIFSPEGDLLGDVPQLSGDIEKLPRKMSFHEGILYVLTEEETQEEWDCYLSAYYYQ